MTEIARLVMAADSSQVKRATDDLQKMQTQGGKTETAMGKLGKTLAGIGAGVAIGKFLGAIISNTIEAEEVQAQLAARLKSTGGVAGQTAESVLALSSALQQQTKFGDEAITSAQTLLLTFTKIQGDIFPRATEAILDVSTAMGTDLNSAALQVGKALNDPVVGLTALSRAGIQFTDAQKDVIKSLVETGDMAGAQTIILEELETQMGGAAEAARNTLGGALAAAQNAFGDLLEGDTGSDGIRGTVTAINSLVETMQSPETKAGFAAMITGLANIANGAAQTISLVAEMTDVVRNSFKEANELTRAGLIQRQIGLEDGIKRMQALDFLPDIFGMRAGQIEEMQTELGEVIALTDKLSMAEHAAALQRTADAKATEAARPRGTAMEDGGNTVIGIAPGDEWEFGVDPRGGSGGVDKAVRDAQREAEQAARDLSDVQRGLNDLLDDQAATLGGELTQAAMAYKDEMVTIAEMEAELIRLGKLDEEQTTKIALARENATKAYQEQTEAIDAQLTPAEQLISDLEFELSLLGMTNDERAKAIELRRLEGEATEEQAAKIGDLLDKMREEGEQVEALDGVRSEFSNFFQDLVKNGEDALDRLQERILDMVLQRLGDQLAESLFGAFGTNQSGSLGGGGGGSGMEGIGGFLASLFGGGRASGGRAARGKMHEILENDQPEILHHGGKSYLLTGGSDGTIAPAQTTNNSNSTLIQNITVPINTEHRTAKQVGAGAYRGAAAFLQRTR